MSSTPLPEGPLTQSVPLACLSDHAVCKPGRCFLTTSKIVLVSMKLCGYAGMQSRPTTNGQVIGHSEMYSSASAMEGGIASVKKNAPDAKLVDLAI